LQTSKRISILVIVFMVLTLVTVMSFTMLLLGVGWTSDFLFMFARNWLIGVVVALPTALLVNIPIVRLVRKICENKKPQENK
jgi:hypothetical protein